MNNQGDIFICDNCQIEFELAKTSSAYCGEIDLCEEWALSGQKPAKLKVITTLPFVKTKEILEHLNAAKFFKEYLPHIKNVKHKMRGIDGNGKDIDFSEEEKKQIIAAVQKFAKDIQGVIKQI